MTRLLVSHKKEKKDKLHIKYEAMMSSSLDEHNVVFGVLYLWLKYFLFLFPDLLVFVFLHGLNMTNLKKNVYLKIHTPAECLYKPALQHYHTLVHIQPCAVRA